MKREQFEKLGRRAPKQKEASITVERERGEKIEREHESSCQFESRFSKITCFLYHLLTLLPASSSMSSRSRKTWKKTCVNTKKLLVTPFKSDQDHSWLANRHHLLSKKTSSPNHSALNSFQNANFFLSMAIFYFHRRCFSISILKQ